MNHERRFIEGLVAKGGPEPPDYGELDAGILRIHRAAAEGRIGEQEIARFRDAFGEALSTETMQGFALRKPHGYAGDFEIIDRIYLEYVSSDPRLSAWDRYYHRHAAPRAVRNRKTYFHRVLDRCRPRRVLNIASGPGRCMSDWLVAHPGTETSFHCVEIDPKAIDHAKRLNQNFLDRVSFTRLNALRFKPSEPYDLVWASGIFDYFGDELFRVLLLRLLRSVARGGELVVGNFSDRNPSRPYMELIGDWRLHHRTPEALENLAVECGVEPEAIRVDVEPEGVNLFLHVTHRPKN